MSLLINTLKQRHIFEAYRVFSATQIRNGHYFPDYKPGPVPKTEEERIKAAEKYNLLPEEYECYEDGEGHGDYPKLPFESVDARDPWYPWDNKELRKDFNEPVHVRIINLLPECLSTTPPDTPHWKGAIYFLSICTICILLLKGLQAFQIVQRASEKQFPKADVTHYTFDKDIGKKH